MQSDLRGRRLASNIIAKAPADKSFDAEAALVNHPELRTDRSAVLELAFEEYCRRCDAGEDLRGSEFAARFSIVERSLVRLIEVDGFIKENSALAENLQEGLWPEIGERFQSFELHEELGRGALSRVFLAAESDVGGRRVVCKVCLRGAQEAHTLGKLDHQGVVPVFSIRHDDPSGFSAICMPFLSRVTLFDVIECVFPSPHVRPTRGEEILTAVREINSAGSTQTTAKETATDALLTSLSYTDAAAEIGKQLAAALAYTHEQGVWHCDIKPTNVLMRPDGQAMLLDFNLSVDQSVGNQAPGGTLPYMAPELLKTLSDTNADPLQANPALDVYSLGVTLYELLAGRLPFSPHKSLKSRAALASQLLMSQQQREFEPLSQVNPDVDRDLARIITRCLALDPAARPSAAALHHDLAAYRSRYRSMRRVGKRYAPQAVACIIAALVIAAGLLLSESGRTVLRWSHLLPLSAAERSQNLVEQAWDLQEAGDHAAAIRLLDDALKVAPNNLTARFARGLSRLEQRDHQGAMDDFEIVAANSDSGIADAYLGYCQGKEEQFASASNNTRIAMEYGFSNINVVSNYLYFAVRTSNTDDVNRLYVVLQSSSSGAAWSSRALFVRALAASHLARRAQGDVNAINSEIVRSRTALPDLDADLEAARIQQRRFHDLAANHFRTLLMRDDVHPAMYSFAAARFAMERPAPGTKEFRALVSVIRKSLQSDVDSDAVNGVFKYYTALEQVPELKRLLIESQKRVRRPTIFSCLIPPLEGRSTRVQVLPSH